MKTIKYFSFLLLMVNFAAAQSIEIGTGAFIDVGEGADICAGNYGNITGTLTGSGTQCDQSPLPVELSVFNASVENNKVNLYWRTETEVNNFGFVIERSVNEVHWDSLAFIKGNGNSNSPREYRYSDENLFNGGYKLFYRLKQINNDGSSEYSVIVNVKVVPNHYELSQNYPNPFNPTTTIRFSLPNKTMLKIILYNALGEYVRTIADGNYEAGYYKINFNAANLSSGVYLYRFESNNYIEVKKMILLK
jgi:Secretion system C-terminal sorting domain